MLLNILWLIIAIGIILVTILKLKFNATIALIIAAVFMGLVSGIGADKTASIINSSFGSLITGIGFSIGFGVILGQLLSDSGAAKVIATKMISISSEKYSLYALGLTGFLLSIPVFYDVTFVILIPLAAAISRQIKKPFPYAVGAVAIGAGAAHTFAPPTPNPLMAADILGFDVGIMILFGITFGLLAAIIAMKIFFTILDKGFWNKEKDETEIIVFEEVVELNNGKKMSFISSIIPVVLPVLLILSGTLAKSTMATVPGWVIFISTPGMALFIAVLLALFFTRKVLAGEKREISANKALGNCGVVLLITGAGASFGGILRATGLADNIAEAIVSVSISPIIALFIAFFIGFCLRFALGSGTVASITAMNIMSSVSGPLAIHPVWIALACLAGSLSIGHINDSGFWVTAKLAGFSISGGLKTYTLCQAIVGVFVMFFAVIGALFFNDIIMGI